MSVWSAIILAVVVLLISIPAALLMNPPSGWINRNRGKRKD